MDYLDEETLVWNAEKSEFSEKSSDDSASQWTPVNSSQNKHGLLDHFNKAENQLLNISSELLAIPRQKSQRFLNRKT